MIAFFLVVLLVPLAITGAVYVISGGISWKEAMLTVAVALLVAGTSAGVVSCSNTYDEEVWNGTVASKQRATVSCSHSYQCNCRPNCTTDAKGDRNCTTVCDTCYEHSHDYNWDVLSSNGETFTIDRIDRQGTQEPNRFTITSVGEPTSKTHSYKNYVKASPETLFRKQGLTDRYVNQVPNYPQAIYDYWRLDRLVTVGAVVSDREAWNADLSHLNSRVGPTRQANAVVVLTHGLPNDYFYALEEAWVGGKKNDVVLVVNVDDQQRPVWAQAMAWTDDEMFKVKLRDDVMDLSIVSRASLLPVLEHAITDHYRRKPMADFEYLSAMIVPTTGQWIITMIIALFVCSGLTTYCRNNDVFGDERHKLTRRRQPR